MALRADDVDLGRDRDLVQRYQAGDHEAFDDLYRRYFERLHRYCRRHTRDSHEAEEVAQEAFVKALGAMHRLDGERRFYPWMTVIAKRITIDRHRKLSRMELTDDPDTGSVEPAIDHLFAAVDAAHVREAMTALGPRHREVLELREARGMSYAEIADHLSVPVTTVEALLHRARKALRREYATVSGESRGLWGLPVLGWVTTRIGDLRAKFGDRWVEIGAVAAPIAVGAATAAVVLVPGHGPTQAGPPVSVHAAGTPVVEVIEDTGRPDDPVVVLPAPGNGTATAGTPEDPGSTPTLEAGGISVFTGPDGADDAADNAEQLPDNASIGPVRAGADAARAVDHASRFLDQTQSDITDVILGENP